jgi:cysteine desulfurase / selenocysteine lyase
VSQHPEFPQRDDLIYLNHAAVAPWPLRTAQAVQRFANENVAEGALHYPAWTETERHLREQLRELLNAPSAADIALLKNTSEALSVVAHGLQWQPGDIIVTTHQEFPSNRIVWESLRAQGVEVRLADLDSAASPEDAIIELAAPRTRLIAVSSVQYATGLRMDLARLGGWCREHEVLFCVDAIQSVGAVRFDVQAVHADFAMADGHKWMLGPEGLAVFYCRGELRERLQLRQYGWHMVEHMGDYDRMDWSVARSARRFECGSPNMLGIHALHASLSLLLETGIERVERELLARTGYLMERIGATPGLELVTCAGPGRYAGIVNFRPTGSAPAAVHRHLAAHGIVCAVRAGGVRFSPHFYTPYQALERACEITAQALA